MSASVLVADDNMVMRNLIKYYLKEFKLNVYEAKDGVEALSIIKSNDIDILFLDLSMPNIDGFNVANYLKSSDKHPHIVSISADINIEKKSLLKSLGVKYFLNKPLDPKAFKDIITKLLK